MHFLDENFFTFIRISKARWEIYASVKELSFVQEMPGCLCGMKPLLAPMMISYQLDPLGQTSNKFWHQNAILLFFTSWTPGRRGCNFKLVIFKLMSNMDILSISCQAVTRPHQWLVNISWGYGLVPSGNKPLPKPLPSFMLPYGITRPQWVDFGVAQFFWFPPGALRET